MKRIPRTAIGLLFAAMIGAAMAPANAQVTGNGPYYATPSWDQSFPSASRFMILTNLGNAAVLDRETGLVWERTPSTSTFVWGIGRVECLNRTIGGRKAWRLPSLHELLTLMDPTIPAPGPALPAGHPFNNVSSPGIFWTSTANSEPTSLKWVVFTGDASVSTDDQIFSLRVWCVRGPSQESVY